MSNQPFCYRYSDTTTTNRKNTITFTCRIIVVAFFFILVIGLFSIAVTISHFRSFFLQFLIRINPLTIKQSSLVNDIVIQYSNQEYYFTSRTFPNNLEWIRRAENGKQLVECSVLSFGPIKLLIRQYTSGHRRFIYIAILD